MFYYLPLAFFKFCQNGLTRKLVSSSAQSCWYMDLVTVKAMMSGGKNLRIAISVAPIIALGLSKSSKNGASRPQPSAKGTFMSSGLGSPCW